ncbi:metallophosphoesterase [Bradyrhizobium sp. WD16]|uniref:metallophosphoesterase family protein n=1 Tax=Bradyrhizobium sp. WD16 TaxID=1521768 RepID=UPI0020A4DA24|nr:metallophosphoesterase [Bradyrhizobium sp. WD16]UTD25882.1 metallophosphatase [Bradyrhizobium sp. WD16]
MQPFVLAHLSDPHLSPLPRPRLHHLLGKRAFGYVNWRRNRHRVHRLDVVEALVKDVKAQRPDHVAVTGDLVNIALPEEITGAAAWLRSIGAPEDVTMVPGNHDAYVASALVHVDRAWGDFMQGDAPGPAGSPAASHSGSATASHAGRFPFLRRRGPVALIGLSTAVPTAPLMATGLIGESQLAALDALLAKLDDDSFRVLLVHHPLDSKRRYARLIDADRLAGILRHRGVDLVLHGHDHRHTVLFTAGPTRPIPVVGVSSASIAAGSHRAAAGYNLIAISRDTQGWRAEMTTRAITGSGTFAEIKRQVLRATA